MRTSKPVIAVAAAAVIAALLLSHDGRARVTVDFFSVGQGDSMLISDAWSQLLIDAGPDRTVLSHLGRSMPFFDRTIEQVAITHPHADHYLGLAAVLERYRVRRLLLPAVRVGSPHLAALVEKARSSGAEIVELGVGDRLVVGGAELAIVWPPRSGSPPAADESDEANDLSLVMRLTTFCGGPGERPVSSPGCGAALFAGDITDGTEDDILGDGTLLGARILKVAHHGSNRSTSLRWLAAVGAELAVIEVGHNSYGHPSVALLRRLQTAGVRAWRTDRQADLRAVFIKTDDAASPSPFVWRLE